MRRYTGLRRGDIVARIEQALGECGAEILAAADPTSAPFEFRIKTPGGSERELVCYAFAANKHRFLIGYRGGSDRCHRLYFDLHGNKITLMFGVNVKMGLFVAVDPMMHNPTWFPRSVDFKTSCLEIAREHRWHGWQRDRSDARRKVAARPEENLQTETVIAFQPDQFLRYVEFERLACGLDCGERGFLSNQIEKNLSQDQALTWTLGQHPLEIQLGLPASDILDMAIGRIGRA